MKKLRNVFVGIMVAAMCLTACGTFAQDVQAAGGGVVCLSVNPKIAIAYDADGNVTEVTARNEDGERILTDYTNYEGKGCGTVVAELVAVIGEAGYFVEDVDGKSRQITLTLETGSELPRDTFLDEVASEVRQIVTENKWTAPVEVEIDGITDDADDMDDDTDDMDDADDADDDDDVDDADDDTDDDDADDADDDTDDTDDADDADDDTDDDTDDDMDDTDDADDDDGVDDVDDDTDDTDDADDDDGVDDVDDDTDDIDDADDDDGVDDVDDDTDDTDDADDADDADDDMD